ncbi:MAG TPA: hypothetical protein VMG09_14320 [Bacteroidota bacterium]|nr:hypothetical protein [Bacteroidota bacterium]
MKSLRILALASISVIFLFGGCSKGPEKGVGVFRVAQAVIRNTVTLQQSQKDCDEFVGISNDCRTFNRYDNAGALVGSVQNLERRHDGTWSGTDTRDGAKYQIIFNDQQDQYVFAVTNLDQKSCTIYVIPKGPQSWDSWDHFLASTGSGHDSHQTSTARM